jgi:hypothetical protein
MNYFFILDAARKAGENPPVLELWFSLMILGLNEPVKTPALQHLFQMYGLGAMQKSARLLRFLRDEGYIETFSEDAGLLRGKRFILSERGKHYLSEMSASLVAIDAALQAQLRTPRPSPHPARAR